MREFSDNMVTTDNLNEAFEQGHLDGIGHCGYSNPYSIDDEEFYHYSAGHSAGVEEQ